MPRDQILQILSKYKQQHERQYGIQALGIFGSVARDESSTDSDLDICIVTETPEINPITARHLRKTYSEGASFQFVEIDSKLRVHWLKRTPSSPCSPFLKCPSVSIT